MESKNSESKLYKLLVQKSHVGRPKRGLDTLILVRATSIEGVLNSIRKIGGINREKILEIKELEEKDIEKIYKKCYRIVYHRNSSKEEIKVYSIK